MWPPSRRQLCLAFLLVCVLSALSFFLHIHQDSFPHGLRLSILCPDRRLVTPPVAIFCLPGTPVGPNTSSSCPQNSASLSGTWTIYPDGRFGNQMGQYATLLALAQLNGRRAFILPAMHAALAPVFRITLPVLAPEVDSRTPWRELQLHDWMSEEYADLRDPFLKLSGFPCSWTFFHHLREQIRREFTLHDHLREEAQSVLGQLRLGRTGDRQHLCGPAPWGLSAGYASALEGCGGRQRLPPAGHGLVPGTARSPGFCGYQQRHGVV
uniref:L-Fucosyltransferase n=1 Tax=Macaca fascicularis TaxID=9541 RepID=A0A7N9IBE7_MACFA